MVEFLIISSCIFGNVDGCENGSIAYYKHSGLEQAVTTKSQQLNIKYPILTSGIAYIAAAAQGRIILNLGSGRYLTSEPSKGIVGFKGEF